VSTTAITVVLLQNSMDLWSGECGSHSGMWATTSEVGNDVYRMQLSGVTEVTGQVDCEPMTSLLIRTDSEVGFMSVECLACFIGIQNCLSIYKSVLVKQ
jgi:hypothetical protein